MTLVQFAEIINKRRETSCLPLACYKNNITTCETLSIQHNENTKKSKLLIGLGTYETFNKVEKTISCKSLTRKIENTQVIKYIKKQNYLT